MTRSSSKLTAIMAGFAATLLTLTSTSSQGCCGMISSSKRTLSTEQQVETVEFPIASNEQNTRGEESDVNNSVSSESSISSSENESDSSSSSSEIVKQRLRKEG